MTLLFSHNYLKTVIYPSLGPKRDSLNMMAWSTVIEKTWDWQLQIASTVGVQYINIISQYMASRNKCRHSTTIA